MKTTAPFIFLFLGALLQSAQADERIAPHRGNLCGRWSLTSVLLDRSNESNFATECWQEGELEVIEHIAKKPDGHITGKMTLKDGVSLQVRGRRRHGRYGAPVRIELVAVGSKPNPFGGPPMELEYEFEGRFAPDCRKDECGLVIRGLVQAITADHIAPEYTVGTFTLTPLDSADKIQSGAE